MIIRPETQRSGVNPLRLKRGTKVADIPSEAPPSLSDIDSSFHLAEYLALKVRHDPHDIEGLVNLPEGAELRGTRSLKGRGSTRGNEGDEKNLWIYEHLRRIPIDLTPLVVLLLQTCTAESCPKMKADEWQYLCVAHGREGAEECSAIDYIIHTLDSTTALLTSHDAFPSRIQIRSGSLDQFPSLFRRLSRIFSHAYYHHRETFHLAEAETSLYARFVALCEKYDLVGSNLLVIPRHVVADTLDGKSPEIEVEEEDEQEDEEEEDEEEEDEAEERDSRSRDKGESGRRPHSLDRHARPHKLDEWRPTLEGTVKGKPTPEPETQPPSYSPPTEDASSSSTTYTNPDPISLSTSQTYSLKPRFPRESSKVKQQIKEARNEREIGTLGRSTLGKKSRGTMLWTSDTDTPAKDTVSTPTAETPEAELERTDSVETAILAPSDLEGDGPVSVSLRTEVGGEDDDEEVAVPKDEIELLEEEAVLETEEAVSPLPPTATLSASTDDQAETKLEADNKPESEAEMEGSEPIIESEPAAHDIVVPEPDLETKSVAEIEPTASPTQEQPVIEMEDKEKGDSEATDDERNKGGKKKKDKKDKA